MTVKQLTSLAQGTVMRQQKGTKAQIAALECHTRREEQGRKGVRRLMCPGVGVTFSFQRRESQRGTAARRT